MRDDQHDVREALVEGRLHHAAYLKGTHTEDLGLEKLGELIGIDDLIRPIIVTVDAMEVARVIGVETKSAVLRRRPCQEHAEIVDVQLAIVNRLDQLFHLFAWRFIGTGSHRC
ncbi:MAG: hypothetical protein DMF90_16110 [Acidobacteria bacterium]|nr:MAG: hypothetical protein DMF90_16110 [Acidobacteriota bacterium]